MKVTLKIEDKVARVLETSKPSQLDDGKLLANVYYHELIEMGYNEGQSKAIASLFAYGKLSHPESVRRTRQKLQSQDPEKYGYNRKHRENEIKDQL